MSAVEPVDPRVRLAIVQWPEDAPRGSVTTFCAEHGISRKTFYEIRRRVVADGPAAALEPKSRRPSSSPNRIGDDVAGRAVAVRAALEQSGLDHGPIRVHEKMRSLGMEPVPSVASLARIFRAAGVAKVEPRKKPRAALRRFVYPAPNACWQLDATEYVLAGGRRRVIFQLIDNHSRFAVASHVAWGETVDAAITVVDKGIAAHGVPQRLLTDNGLALNPSRRGFIGQLVAHVSAMGVEPITGKPYRPTTQGKNERFHQTLFRFLDKQPLAGTLDQLQEQVDAFDQIYNTNRPHQGLPGRITPHQAWEATLKTDPPRPRSDAERSAARLMGTPIPAPHRQVGDGIGAVRIGDNGTVYASGTKFQSSSVLAGQIAFVIWETETIHIFDDRGTLIVEYPWPKAGTKYVGSGNSRGRRPRIL